MTGFPSVRARLTAWNVGVVALVLIASGAAVRYLLQASLMAAADRELGGAGRFWAGALAGPRPTGFGRPWRFRPFGGPPQGFRPPGRPPATTQSPPQPFPPRVMDREGKDWGSGRPLRPWDQDAYIRSLRGEEVHATI